jgi:hypothetical protein
MNKNEKSNGRFSIYGWTSSWVWVVGSHCFYKTQSAALLRQHGGETKETSLQMCRELNPIKYFHFSYLDKCTYLKYSHEAANCRLISATLIPPLGSQTCVTKPGISMFSSLKYKHSHTFHVNRCGTRSFINLSYAIYVCVSKSN